MLSQYHRDLHSILKFSEDAGYDKNGAVIHHYRIDDENDIYEFNQRALQFEYVLNKDFVAGARKDGMLKGLFNSNMIVLKKNIDVL